MRTLRLSPELLLLLAVLAPGTAMAQSLHGFYVGAAGGLDFAGSPRSTGGGAVQFDTNAGWLGLAGVGWAFANGLRIELEGSYGSSSVRDIETLRVNGSREPLSNPTGSLRTSAIMVNGAYDIPLTRLAAPFQPYIGAGLGCAWLDLGTAGGSEPAVIHLPENNTYMGPATISYGSGGAFAYQAIAGVSMPFLFRPGLEATLEYRFFGTARANIRGTATAQTTNLINGLIPSGQDTHGYLPHENSVSFGLRYRF